MQQHMCPPVSTWYMRPQRRSSAERAVVASFLIAGLLAAIISTATPAQADDGVVDVDAGDVHTCAVLEDGSVRCWGVNRSGAARPPSDLGPVTAVSAGGSHTCAVRTDQTVRCWGDDADGRTSPPADLIDVVAVSAGFFHTCALTEGGNVICWGTSDGGETDPPDDLGVVTAISAGTRFTCAVEQAGGVRCWGGNTQLGQTPDLADIETVAAGGGHACAVTTGGGVRCWGFNTSGQADPPADLGAADEVAAGRLHSCARLSAGGVRCWGSNIRGQSDAPDDLSDVAVVTAGEFRSCVLAEYVRCWGEDGLGASSPPTDIGRLEALDSGVLHVCAVTTADTVRCWGDDLNGQGTPPDDLGAVEHISTNSFYSCAVTTDGAVTCWGRADLEGTQPPSDLAAVRTVTVGSFHTCAVTTDDRVRCWGEDSSGQASPPDDLGAVRAVTAGSRHSCALLADDSVRCWGDDSFGQSTPPDPLTAVQSLAGGESHSCALLVDGSVRCWGADSAGQSSPPADLPPAAQIGLGNGHSCALLTGGLPRCWGDNTFGQLDPPEHLEPVVQVSAGASFICALDVDQRPVCWGGDPYGRLGSAATIVAPAPDLAILDEPYRYRAFITGAPTPDVSVTAGRLPDGLALTPAGAVVGNPTELGRFGVTITADTRVTGPPTSEAITIDVHARPTVAIDPDPPTVRRGDRLELSATAIDPDGGDVTLAWDLDGDEDFDDAVGQTVILPTDTVGTTTVSVRVTDDEGATAVAVTTATVRPRPAAPDETDLQIVRTDDPADAPGAVRVTVTNPTSRTIRPTTPVEIIVLGQADVVSDTVCEVEQDDGVTRLACSLDAIAPGETITILVTVTPTQLAPAEVLVAGDSLTVQPDVPADPIAAAIAVSQLRFGDGAQSGFAGAETRSASHVVLSRADVFADSLAGSALADEAPLLFTDPAVLDDRTAEEIDRLLDGDGVVYLLGGPQALSPAVADALTDSGYTLLRLAGESRIETAIAVADEVVALAGEPGRVAIARADAPAANPTAAWADAVAAGGWAADTRQPILLTPTSTLHPATRAWLEGRPDVDVSVLGGSAAVGEQVLAALEDPERNVSRTDGANRFATAAAIAAELWADPAEGRIIAPGGTHDGWAFALAAAGLAADTHRPILLTELDRLPRETDEALCAPDATRRPHLLLAPEDQVDAALLSGLAESCDG